MKTIQKFLMLFLLALISNAMPAQVSNEVKEIMGKCQEKLNNPKGVEMNMEGKVLIAKTQIRTVSKGDKLFMSTSVKALGETMTMDMGFDGTQMWSYNTESDSLVISKTTKKPEKQGGPDISKTSKYKTAKMKEKNGIYEIAFTNPINKNEPSKFVLKINKSNYYPTEIQIGSGLRSITFNITKIKVGNIDDNIFVPDPKKYPTAKVVRK